jgi:hypothetical protein
MKAQAKSSDSVRVLVAMGVFALGMTFAVAEAEASEKELAKVCSDVMRIGKQAQTLKQGPKEGEPVPSAVSESQLQQKLQHCQAAESQRRAQSASKATAAVWTGVAGICASECFMTLGMGGGGYCTVSNIGGTVAEMAITRQFSNALGQLASTGIGMLSTKATGGSIFKFGSAPTKTVEGSTTDAAGKAAAGVQKQRNWGSCVAAATAGYQAYQKWENAHKTGKQFQESLAEARKLMSPREQAEFAANMRRPGARDSAYGNVNAGSGVVRLQGTNVAESSDPCAKAIEVGDTNAAIQCAVKSDPSIPTAMVAKNGFVDTFKKASGLDMSDLLTNQNATGAQALTAGMGGGLSSQGVQTLASAVKQLETDVLSLDDSATAYAANGSGGGADLGASDGEDEMAKAMAALMNGMNPKQEEESNGVSETAIQRANRTRSPAAIAEDPNLSIFERVTFRYSSVSRELFKPTPEPIRLR